MIRSTLSAGAALAVLACSGGGVAPATAPAPAVAAKLYVVNQAGATISVIDQVRLAVDTVIDLRGLGFTANAKPHHIAVEADGSHWYVSLIGDGRVLKFDRSNKLLAQVRMETPGLLTLDPVHDSLYVGRSMTAVNPPKALGVIARRNFTLVDEQEIVIPRPHALAVTLDGKWVHTASLAENRIASVETATGRVTLTTIPGAAALAGAVCRSRPMAGRWWPAGNSRTRCWCSTSRGRRRCSRCARSRSPASRGSRASRADGRSVYVTLLAKNAMAEIDPTPDGAAHAGGADGTALRHAAPSLTAGTPSW